MFLFLLPTITVFIGSPLWGLLSASSSSISDHHHRLAVNVLFFLFSGFESKVQGLLFLYILIFEDFFFPNLMAQNSRGVELLKIMFPIEADVEGKASSKKKKKTLEDAAKLPGVHVRTQQDPERGN